MDSVDNPVDIQVYDKYLIIGIKWVADFWQDFGRTF